MLNAGIARSSLVAVVIVLIIAAAVGYLATGSQTVTSTLTRGPSLSYTWVSNNATVRGLAEGIPCGALHLPCTLNTSSNVTTTAGLILFLNKYYYDSN